MPTTIVRPLPCTVAAAAAAGGVEAEAEAVTSAANSVGAVQATAAVAVRDGGTRSGETRSSLRCKQPRLFWTKRGRGLRCAGF